MRIFPETTSNRNVPASAIVILETTSMSGEIGTTYYADTHDALMAGRQLGRRQATADV